MIDEDACRLTRQACVFVGAGLPAIGCEAVVNSVSALGLALRIYRFYDCYAADRRQASTYSHKTSG